MGRRQTMPNSSSQEKNIYRNLAAQIQSGFYSDGKRFPSAKEIASQFRVSYCPAQRALKALAQDGLIKTRRGMETVVLKKPHDHFLESETFKKRIDALIDLSRTLRLLSPAITFQGMCHMGQTPFPEEEARGNNRIQQWRKLYRLFDDALSATGSQTVSNLFYDINSFVESAFLDIFQASHTPDEENSLLDQLVSEYTECLGQCQNGHLAEAKNRLEALTHPFFEKVENYLAGVPADKTVQETFTWTPLKGRTRYSDMIAIDLVRKINEGTYPAGTLLPVGPVLADIYHVSPITIRRTIGLLNKLEAVKTINGVGSRVVAAENTVTSDRLRAIVLGNNLKTFLEACQLLAITSEPFIRHSFSHFPEELVEKLRKATTLPEPKFAISAVTAACLQGVVRYCPLAAVREIYSKLTLLLLNGSAITFNNTELAIGWTVDSKMLASVLKAKDGHRFAFLCSRMFNDIFAVMKSHLKKIGVTGIDPVVQPLTGE